MRSIAAGSTQSLYRLAAAERAGMLADDPPVLTDHDAIRIGLDFDRAPNRALRGLRWHAVGVGRYGSGAGQSMTWEGIRSMYPPSFKRMQSDTIKRILAQRDSGTSLDDIRQQLINFSRDNRGFVTPPWVDQPGPGSEFR
jgi:hypothetical protein